MAGLRALAGYMDTFADADEAAQDRMLEEMTKLVEVSKGLATTKATQQATRIAGTEETRRAERHPIEMDVERIARQAAFQALEESARVREHERAIRPLEIRRETAGVETAEAGAEWAPRREAAEVGQLQQQVQTGQLEYKTLSDNYNRLLQAYKDVEATGIVSPQFAQAAAPGIRYEEDYAKMRARQDYDVATKEAMYAASDAELKNMVNEIRLRNPHYTVEQIEGDIEFKRAQTAKLFADALAVQTGGKGGIATEMDYVKMIQDATEFLDQLSKGVDVRTAVEIWGVDSPIYVSMMSLLTDKSSATKHVEGFLRYIKIELKDRFGVDYDKQAAEGYVPAPPAPPPAPAPGTLGWDVNFPKSLEGVRGGTSQ